MKSNKDVVGYVCCKNESIDELSYLIGELDLDVEKMGPLSIKNMDKGIFFRIKKEHEYIDFEEIKLLINCTNENLIILKESSNNYPFDYLNNDISNLMVQKSRFSPNSNGNYFVTEQNSLIDLNDSSFFNAYPNSRPVY